MKSAIRKRGRSGREALSREEIRSKSRQIARRLFARPEYRGAQTLICYLEADREVETGEIIESALREGRRVAVPLAIPGTKTLRAVLIRDPRRDLAPGFQGIREPADRAQAGIEPGELDLALVPGTAFDPAGNRLGRGGGYYDHFLPRLRPDARRIGLAFECQMVEGIAAEPHDAPMDMIITEDRVVKPEKKQKNQPISRANRESTAR